MAARLERVRAVVDAILDESPATLLQLKRRLATELSIEPKAEVLQALAALHDMTDPGARELATRAAVLHLTLESTYDEVWERREADPAALESALATVPSILDLAHTEVSALEAALESIDRLQRDAVARIHGALKRPEEPLIAALSVVPELARLIAAGRAGRLVEEAPYLHAEEAEILSASSAPAADDRPQRALVDSIALRSAIERGLAEGMDLPGLAELRAAHVVVSHRLDALRARRFEQTRKSDPQLDAARKRLFTTYIGLSKALAGEVVEPTGDVRERILAAEREGAAIDAEKAQAAEALKSAAERTADAPREAAIAPDARDLARERRRKKVLTWTVAALVPIAAGVNLWLMPRGRTGALVELQPLNVAMPVSEAMPIGGVLYSQVASFLWDGMSDDERTRKLTDLGKIAGRQGFRSVVVVDDSRAERGYWTAAGGAVLRRRPESGTQDPGIQIGPVGP